MKIEAGKKYLCIRDVVMRGDNNPIYIEGRTYLSERDGCITDEEFATDHGWSDVVEEDRPELFFQEVLNEEFVWGEEVKVMNDLGLYTTGYYYIGRSPMPNSASHIVLPFYGAPTEVLKIRKSMIELTKQQIADKFEIKLEQLKIVD